MNVFALALRLRISRLHRVTTTADFGQLSLDVKGEGAKFAHIHTLPTLEFHFEVLAQGLPDDEHLRFGLNGLHAAHAALIWNQVTSWIQMLVVHYTVSNW